MSARLCLDGCGRTITARSVSGLCKPCNAARLGRDRAARAKAAATNRARSATPEGRAKARDTALRAMVTRKSRPGAIEALRASGRRLGLSRVGNAACPAGSEVRRNAGRKSSETKMAWCPPEFRETYQWLRQTKQMRAPEARAVIEQEISVRAARRTPFERQMEALRQGAKLVAKPDLRDKREFAFTLGGVSPL